jgi:hypothetical protein
MVPVLVAGQLGVETPLGLHLLRINMDLFSGDCQLVLFYEYLRSAFLSHGLHGLEIVCFFAPVLIDCIWYYIIGVFDVLSSLFSYFAW